MTTDSDMYVPESVRLVQSSHTSYTRCFPSMTQDAHQVWLFFALRFHFFYFCLFLRFQERLKDLFKKRRHIRKTQMESEGAKRELKWKVTRKEQSIKRVQHLTGSPVIIYVPFAQLLSFVA